MSVNDGIRGAHGKGEVFLPLNAQKPPNGGHGDSREGMEACGRTRMAAKALRDTKVGDG